MSTGLDERIFRCPSMTPDGEASLEVALPASIRTMDPTIRFFTNIAYLIKKWAG